VERIQTPALSLSRLACVTSLTNGLRQRGNDSFEADSSAKNGYYIYLDFPKGNALRETAIPIREDKGNRHLEDDDIKQFLKKEFGEKMPVFSYWTT
jgi:hypothetical protein